LKNDVEALQALLQSTRREYGSSLEDLAKVQGQDRQSAQRAARQLHSEIDSLAHVVTTSNAASSERACEIERKVSGCCTKEALDRLYERMAAFSKKADLDELREEVHPKLEEWDTKIAE